MKLCCNKFRNLFIDITNIDPFKSVTIASACNKYLRTYRLKENTIGIIPNGGYNNPRLYSKAGIYWLEYLMKKEKIYITHAQNNGERKIHINGKTYYVDGYCDKTNTIYEFFGCYYHGCNKCFVDEKNKR